MPMETRTNGPSMETGSSATGTPRREAVADKLQQAADMVRDRAQQAGGPDSRIQRAASKTADGMTAAADYMRSHDMNDVGRDLTNVVKRYPGQALAAALVLGVLAGRSMRRD